MTTALALIAACAAGAPGGGSSEMPATNVVLVMADDLGAEWLRCYNSDAPPTPRLDALAAGGTRFARAFSQPLCTPSRVTLMTGRYNYRNYVRFGFLPPSERTLGDLFRGTGYRTGIFGKWQLSGQGGELPDAVDPADWGFDASLLWQLSRRPGHGDKGPRYWNPKLETGGAIRPSAADDYGPDLFVDALLEFAAESGADGDGDRPFLAYYPMVLTHDPFLPTPETGPPRKKRDRKSDPDRFAETVRYTDRLVGRLLDGLAAAGLRENTAVIFCGDNGTHRSVVCPTPHGPYRGGKGELNDRGTWVPLIVAPPTGPAFADAPRGVTDDRPVDFTALLPTALTLAGVPLPEDLDGVSPVRADGSPAEAGEAGARPAFVWYDPRHGAGANRHAGAFAHDGWFRLHADGRFVDSGELLDPAETELTAPLTAPQRAARDRLAATLEYHAARGGDAPAP